MIRKMIKILREVLLHDVEMHLERIQLALGRIEARQLQGVNIHNIIDAKFQVTSQ